MYLIDTNVISALRRPEQAPESLIEWASSASEGDLYVSAITLYEIDIGIRRLERRDPAQAEGLRGWFDRRVVSGFRERILPVDHAVSIRAAALQVPDPMPEADGFIAATALVHRLTLVTRNVRNFARTGVKIVNPWNS